MKEQLNEDLLARYFDGVASENELAELSRWLDSDESHPQILADYHKIWKTSVNETFRPDVEKAWQKVAASTVKKTKRTVMPWAAAIAGILLLGSWLVFFRQEKEMVYLSARTEKATEIKTLADRSVITLNAFSLLEYPEEFSDKERRVKIIGEAFFDIERDENRPFIIEANGTEVKVLGTSFLVNARNENVKVSVNSGLVEFSSPKKQKILLRINEQAVYEADNDTIKATPILDRNVFAFKTKQFEFNHTGLHEVVNTLSKGYQADIRLKGGGWESYRLSTRFENENLKDALLIVAETFDLNLTQSDSTYVFSKKPELQ
jgi:transmembrane sensor